MVTQFLSLKDYELATDAQELIEMLLENAWYKTQQEQKDRIDFFAPGFYSENSRFKVCIAHHQSKYWSYKESGKWAVSKYKGILLMGISQGQFDLVMKLSIIIHPKHLLKLTVLTSKQVSQ